MLQRRRPSQVSELSHYAARSSCVFCNYLSPTTGATTVINDPIKAKMLTKLVTGRWISRRMKFGIDRESHYRRTFGVVRSNCDFFLNLVGLIVHFAIAIMFHERGLRSACTIGRQGSIVYPRNPQTRSSALVLSGECLSDRYRSRDSLSLFTVTNAQHQNCHPRAFRQHRRSVLPLACRLRIRWLFPDVSGSRYARRTTGICTVEDCTELGSHER